MNIDKIKIYIHKTIIILILQFIFQLFFISNSKASTIYYSDNFNDQNDDGWEVNFMTSCGDSYWYIDSLGRYGIDINSVWGCKTQSIWKIIKIPDDKSYIYEFDMNFTENANMDRNFYIKYKDLNHWYGFHIVNNEINFEKVLVNETYETPGVEYYSFQNNETYHIKTIVNDDNIILSITNPQNQIKEFIYKDKFPILDNEYVGFRAGTGEITSSKVRFDNVILQIFDETNLDKFNLPFNYPNRNNPSEKEFNLIFWNNLTASFDHNKLGNKFTPFTTYSYSKKSCPKGTVGITCYDSHNGTDFAPITNSSKEIMPTTDGQVVYISNIDSMGNCISEISGYGCIIIIYHPSLDLYTLYAHLSKILVNVGDKISYSDTIGVMGNTGCKPRCGIHIHLGVLKDKTPKNIKNYMTNRDWESILKQSEPNPIEMFSLDPRHYCTYKSPNGNILSFQDPSGWVNDNLEDPWASSVKGNCNTLSPYLWLYDVGIN